MMATLTASGIVPTPSTHSPREGSQISHLVADFEQGQSPEVQGKYRGVNNSSDNHRIRGMASILSRPQMT